MSAIEKIDAEPSKKIGWGDPTALCDEADWRGRDGVLAEALLIFT